MKELKIRLESLCVFRSLLKDPVISSLLSFLEAPANSAYAEFAAALYEANGGNISEYIREICENSENVYVKSVGAMQSPSAFLKEALSEELKTLQAVADLTPEFLQQTFPHSGFLPGFASYPIHLAEQYTHRVEHIGRYGYGIYAKNRMFYVDACNSIVPVCHPDQTELSDLIDYERERKIVLDNTRALLAGKPAANILLTGDAGTGKSATVKAVTNAFWKDGIRMIELRKDQLSTIPKILDELATNPLKFILFIDDLSFLKDDDQFNSLKAVLEGSVTAISGNVVIYATSNRRHLIKESHSDREGDDVHRNDTMQELLSLSERFGIHITFSRPNKETFLDIVHHMAGEKGIDLPQSELDLLAERFALERGGRSARLARQFIDGLLSRY